MGEGMDSLSFSLQVLPPAVVAGLATMLGSQVLAGRLPPAWEFPLLILGLLLFVGMLTFRMAGGWTLAVLVAFGLAAGTLLGQMLTGSGAGWPLAWLLAAALLALGAALSGSLPPWWLRLGFGLWLAALIYLAGWIALALLRLPTASQAAWALGGVVIFALLGSVWFASLGRRRPNRPSSLAVDLYILAFNLAVALRVLSGL